MGTRAIFLDSVTFLFGAFICLFHFGILGFNILLSSLGVVSGIVFGVALSLTYIHSLEKNGEFKATLKTWAFTLFTIIILLSIILYLLFSFGLEAGIQIGSFIYPFIPALFGARIVLYSNWERKHKKHILFDGLVLTRVYAVPRDLESRVS